MKFKFIILLSLAFVATLMACEDHETRSTPLSLPTFSNEIQIDGTTSRMQQAILQYSTKPEHSTTPSYRHELGLLTNGFTTHYDASQGLMVRGEGTSIWITFNAPTTELALGTYTFNESEKEAGAYDFWYGSVNIDGKRYRFISGAIEVQQAHDGLQIINVTGKASSRTDASDQKEIRATFSGQLLRFKSL